jgi:hypothetical protein
LLREGKSAGEVAKTFRVHGATICRLAAAEASIKAHVPFPFHCAPNPADPAGPVHSFRSLVNELGLRTRSTVRIGSTPSRKPPNPAPFRLELSS